MDYEQILAANWGTPWAILPSRLDQIRRESARKAARRAAATPGRTGPSGGAGIAVLGLYGVLNPKFDAPPFLTSLEWFSRSLDQALADNSIGAIACDIDSPGGSVALVQETAAKILAARGQKPLISVGNAQAASAAFWIATAFDEFVITPSGEAGSVGVFTQHVDQSKQNAMLGLDVTYVSAGPYKTEWNPDMPLSKEAFDFEQKRINGYYEAFVSDVAKGRGVTPGTAKRDFGGGRCLSAKDCVKAGMADRVASFDQVMGELAAAFNPKARGYSSANRQLLTRRLARLRESRATRRRGYDDVALLRQKLRLRTSVV